jgi:hypothetical protein
MLGSVFEMLDIYRAIFYLHCRAGGGSIEHETFRLGGRSDQKIKFHLITFVGKRNTSKFLQHNAVQYVLSTVSFLSVRVMICLFIFVDKSTMF